MAYSSGDGTQLDWHRATRKRIGHIGTPRWAEAIQNEIEAQTEAIAAAIPSSTQLLQNYPNPFPTGPTGEDPYGTHIPLTLASRSSQVEIRIFDIGGSLVRTETVGFTGTSPQGDFSLDGHAIGNILEGTSFHWAMVNNQNEPVGSGTYYAYLYINGNLVDGPISMVKQ